MVMTSDSSMENLACMSAITFGVAVAVSSKAWGILNCLVLANRDSLNVMENFVYGDTPELQGIRYVLDELSAAIPEGQWEFMLLALSDKSNIR